MLKFIEYWIEDLLHRLVPIPKIVRKAVGSLVVIAFLLGWVITSIHNLYSFAVYGMIYSSSHGGKKGEWISYSDHPTAFVICIAISSLPFLILSLYIYGYFNSKRAHKKSAFRQFVEGSGPPPQVRRWED